MVVTPSLVPRFRASKEGNFEFSRKALSGGQFKRTGMLNRPPKVPLTAIATLQANHLTEDSWIVGFVSKLQAKMAPTKLPNSRDPPKRTVYSKQHMVMAHPIRV
jgi:hypothetical protein